MNKIVLLQARLILVAVACTFFSIQSEGRDITNNTTWEGKSHSTDYFPNPGYSARDLSGYLKVRNFQEPGDTLTKEELKAIKKEERAARKAERAESKALARAERQARVIDNPNHADFVILGEDLPTGRGVLDAISGRVPGMMISSDGYVVTHGPSSFYGGGTPLFLVDEIEVSRDYANSIPIEDIARVEVFTGPSSAIYGSRAGTGVISIYTRSSVNQTPVD